MKRGREFVVSEMEAQSSATVHGMKVELSPMKTSSNNPDLKYFSGKITDGKKTARVVSFESKLRSVLEKSKEEKEPVAFIDCNIKEGKYYSDLEIMVNHRTKVEISPKRFKIDDFEGDSSKNVQCLDEIGTLAINQHINVIGKVVKVGCVTTVAAKKSSRQLKKQDVR